MPIIQSAKKDLRKNARRRTRNLRYKNAMKNALKQMRAFIAQGNKEEAKKRLPGLYKILDKSAKENVIEKNTAARHKSRITKKVYPSPRNKS